MLNLIRNKQHTLLIKIVFWAIIAAFVGTIFLVWGKGDDAAGTPNVAVSVNGSRIGYDEYQSAYSNLYRLYQDIYREQFTPALEKQLGLRRQALDALIQQTLLLQEAKRLGLQVDRQELVDSIAGVPAFQENGVFSRERYLQVLSYQRMSPEGFEEMQRRQLLIEKVQSRIQQGISISDAEIEQEFRNRNEKINLAFLRLTPDQFADRVRLDEDGLKTFFAEHQESFRLPERVALRYLRFEPARYLDEVTFEQGELEKWYRRHLDRFDVPEQVKASHILIKVPQDADTTLRKKKQELAEKVLAEVQAGKDFSQLARKHSEDPGSASRGGDLGYFTRGTMVPPFEQAAFVLKPGETSGLVETPFGFHILRVEERIEPRVKPLEEVLEEVKAALRAESARQLAFEKAMDAYNIHRKDGDLQAVAGKYGLEVRETGFFDRQEGTSTLGDAPEVVSVAFALQSGELAKPVTLPDGVLLFGVRERQESRLPELKEVRAEAEQAYRQVLAREKAREAAEKILAALQDGQSLESAAKGHGLKVEETGTFTRATGSFIPRLGGSEEVAKTAFSLTPQAPVANRVFEQDGKFVITVLKDRQEADSSALSSTVREEIRESLLAQRKTEALEQTLEELRTKAEITIAPTIASSLERENS